MAKAKAKETKAKTMAEKPKLTDAERHKRFVDMAHQVEASDDPVDFDRAFEQVAKATQKKPEP